MNNFEEIVLLIKNNLDIFPYIGQMNENIEFIEQLYIEEIDITKYLSVKCKNNKRIIEKAIDLNPLNILNFDTSSLSIEIIVKALKRNNKIIQFLNISEFKKNKIKNVITNLDNFDYSTIKNDDFFVKDRNFMKCALDKSPHNIIYFRESLDKEEYKSLFLEMLTIDFEVFKILNNELIEDDDYMLKILKSSPETYTLFPNHKRATSKIKHYVYKEGIKETFKFLTYDEKTEDIIFEYLKVAEIIEENSVFADKYSHPKLFRNKDILLKLILNNCVTVADVNDIKWAKEEEIVKILRKNGNFFSKLNKKQQANSLFIKAATLESYICCEFFFESFYKYPEAVELVLEKNIKNYEQVNDHYRKEKRFIAKYLEQNPKERFKGIPKLSLEESETMFYLSSLYPELLELMPDEFRKNKNNSFRLIDENPLAFKYIDFSLKNDKEIVEYAISKNIMNIYNMGFELYDDPSIINNFFERIISGEKYEGSTLFIAFFKDVMNISLFIKSLEVQGSLFDGIALQMDEKEYLIAALKGGFQGAFNPTIKMDSDLLYVLLKYHPEPIGVLHSDFFLTEEDMVIKVLGENPELLKQPFFYEYKITLSFAEKLIKVNPENITYIMDEYFFSDEIKDMSLIDKVIVENPEKFKLITKILDQIEGFYLLNRDSIIRILDYYISNSIDKENLYFLYKIPEILRNKITFKIKYEKIFGEKRNFINEVLCKVNLMKNNNLYPFITERFEAIILENKEKEEEAKKLEDLFNIRNFIDKTFLIDIFTESRIHRQINEKYFKDTKYLLSTIYHLKDRKGTYSSKIDIIKHEILKYVEIGDVVKEDFIEYIGLLYLECFQFKEKDIIKLYGYKEKRDKDSFINTKILITEDLKKNKDKLNEFILESIFIGNKSSLKTNYFDNSFKLMTFNGSIFDIKQWGLYKKTSTILPLRKVICELINNNKLDYIDIDNFYKEDKTRSEKNKNDLIYTHRKKIENEISSSLENLLGWKIIIIPEKENSRKFSLILEKPKFLNAQNL